MLSASTQIKLKIKYFAIYEDIKKRSEENLILEKPMNLKALFFRMMEMVPLKEQYFKATLFAVNQRYVSSEYVVRNGDEVAFIPPVSGG